MAKNKRARLKDIREFLEKNERATVSELCDLFNVSSITIRNDLTILENEGVLIRTHGGAVIKDKSQEDNNYTKITPPIASLDQIEKMASIAKVAAEYIRNATWIYISSGQTGLELAKRLQNRRLNIVTGGLDNAILLSGSNLTTVFVPGGLVVQQPNGYMLMGDWYIRALEEMRFDQAFTSVSGVDFETGFSVGSSTDFLHMEKIKQVSRETIVVVDSTKFDHRAFMPLGDIAYADTIITNADIPAAYREYILKKNIKLITD